MKIKVLQFNHQPVKVCSDLSPNSSTPSTVRFTTVWPCFMNVNLLLADLKWRINRGEIRVSESYLAKCWTDPSRNSQDNSYSNLSNSH